MACVAWLRGCVVAWLSVCVACVAWLRGVFAWLLLLLLLLPSSLLSFTLNPTSSPAPDSLTHSHSVTVA